MRFIIELEKAFIEKNDSEKAFTMAKCMRNKFDFFGIKTTERRELFNEIWKKNKQEVTSNARVIAVILFKKNNANFIIAQ